MKKITYLGIVLLSIGLFVLSCGKDDGPEKPDPNPNPNPNPTTIELDKTSLKLYPFPFYTEGLQVTTDIGSATVAWSSSNEDVAAVNANGEVTPLAIGTTTITAKVGEATATCSINVADGPVNELTLDEETLELFTNEMGGLSLTIDAEVENTSAPVWHSDDETVATVDQEGNVTGQGTGTVEVSVTVDNMTIAMVVTVNPNVYVVGSADENAVIWKNGTPSILALPEGFDSYSYANDVFVTDSGDVYIAGHAHDGFKYQAMVWINGVPKVLNELGYTHGYAHSVVVDDSGNFYVGGYEWDGTYHNGMVWINGTAHEVSDEEVNDKVFSIAVDTDGDVYATGIEEINTLDRAILWKLDVETEILAENNQHVNASGVALSGTDIYVVGSVEENGVQLARRWDVENDVGVDLNENMNNNASASDVVVDNGVVFTVGTEYEFENGNTAKLWIDETAVALSNEVSTNANSVKVDPVDKTVYIAGQKNLNGPDWAARLWIKRGDDIETKDLSESYQNSGARAVFIK
ncbi:Ig-like domain-containing protein [Flagellimonas algicola]|uniref:BIG2 domain-containing protein n=1 Tax=Flagellimonas algicola TaxID=2583815 RepID=A0ABY2WK47_9FLAO|nr:Ig-like domain-containing protein [Allomuricauda algicola]TMU55226.1 hypothetical protein FGG15_13670 [Allomuricauda algicola]